MKELDRRNFLKGAAVTAVGAMGAATLAACSPTSKEDKDAAAASAGSPEGELYNTAATSQRAWSFEIPPEPIADADIKETIEAELVVVGCGTAPLAPEVMTG